MRLDDLKMLYVMRNSELFRPNTIKALYQLFMSMFYIIFASIVKYYKCFLSSI